MTSTETKTKPVEQVPVVSSDDMSGVDELLAQVDALVDETANAVGEEPALDAQPSAASETAASPSDGTTDDSVQAAPVVNPAGEINSTLDDLDNLLQELGEKPAAEAEAPAGDDALTQSEAAAATEVDSEAAPAKADANPYADEVARMEQQWAAGAADCGDAGSTQAASDAVPAPGASRSASAAQESGESAADEGRSLSTRVAHGLAVPLAGLLAVLDAPFARLSPSIKNICGYAGVATMAVAIALWVAGPHLIRLPMLAPATTEAKTMSGGSHSQAKTSESSGEGNRSQEKQ